MNGRPSPALLPDQTLSNRLFAALMASSLLHAAVIVMPYLGASTTLSRPAVLKPGPARALQVRLVPESVPVKGPGNAAGRASPESPARALGADVLPIPAPAYYTTDQLTRRPRPTSQPGFLVPELGPAIPSGKVILKLWINELGNVASVEVEKSELPEAIAANAAAAFGKLRFEPGQINGRPVGTLMRIEVIYYDGAGPPP